MTNVAVCSRSFSKHPILRAELLERYPHTRFNESGAALKGQDLIEFLGGQEKAIIALEPIDEETLKALPDLRVISKYGVGFDKLDLVALREHGIHLGWTPGVNKRSVSELALCFMIALLRHIPESDRTIRSGAWCNQPGRLLSERVVGLVGCGHVGKDLGRILRAFGARVIANDLVYDETYHAQTGVEQADLSTLISQSEIISLHLPLDETTRMIIGAAELAAMRPDALLINTARGGLVDETALANALHEKRIGGAAFDVFEMEPPDDNPLMRLDRFLATSHLGGSTEESILAMGRAAIEGLDKNRLPEIGVFPK